MKTKLFGKITLFAFALMVTMSFGFMSPMLINSLYGATSIVRTGQGHIIELTDYTSSYEYGQEQEFKTAEGTKSGYQIPTPKAKSIAGAEVSTPSIDVRTSAGKKIAPQMSSDGEWFIQVNKSGVYHITYSIENSGVTTATRSIDISIETKEVAFEFAENSAQIIPTTAVTGDKIVFPIPSIVQGDDKLEGTTFDVESGIFLTSGTTARTLVSETIDNVKYATYTVTADDYGVFTVTYKYTYNGNDIFKKFTFNVVKSAQEVEMRYSGYSSNLENLTLSVGKEVTFPTPTVVNTKANDAVMTDVYTVITVKNKTTGTETKVTDFKFTPSEDGDYLITYKTTDLNGKHSYSTQINKNGVKKSGDSIQLKVVAPYETSNVATMKENFDDLETVEYDIPSLVYKVTSTNKEVTFPAVFAIGGWGDYTNLKITRSIYKNNSLQKTLDTPANEQATYTFKSAGNYSIRYEAQYIDAEGNVISGTSKQLPAYTFVVEESDVEVTEDDLTINAPATMPKTVRKGNTITFSAPTVTDYKKGTSEVADKNVKVDVTYTYNGSTTPYTATKNEDGTYSIKVVEPTSFEGTWKDVNQVVVTFKATNDLGNVKEVTATVAIADYSTDNTAPTMSTPADGSVVEGKIALSTVHFTDTQTTMSVVAYVIKDGKVVKTFNGATGLDVTLENLVYEPTEAGDYIVTYVATDQNNNTTTFSELYNVAFNDGANVSISAISAQEYGTRIDLLDYIQLTKNGNSVDMSTITVKMQLNNEEVTQSTLDALADNTLLIQVTGDCRRPASNRLESEIITEEGNIEVRAWAKIDGICDFDKNGSAKISFATSDSKAPNFTIEDESFGSLPYEKNVTEIELPWFENVTDNADIDESTMKITLTYQNSDETKPVAEFTSADFLEAQDAGTTLKFVPPFATNSTENRKEGKVNVVYSVKDIHGLEATRTFVLSIGDVTPPEIVINENAITVPSKVTTDGKISIDLSKIDIDDNETLSTDDLTIVVKRDGTTLTTSKENGIVTVDANTAGTYVITFDIKDSAGNSALTVTKTFTVSNETITTTNTTTVWGTILIVVSLIVLGVVIFFFVKPSKGKNGNVTISNKKEKDDKDNK